MKPIVRRCAWQAGMRSPGAAAGGTPFRRPHRGFRAALLATALVAVGSAGCTAAFGQSAAPAAPPPQSVAGMPASGQATMPWPTADDARKAEQAEAATSSVQPPAHTPAPSGDVSSGAAVGGTEAPAVSSVQPPDNGRAVTPAGPPALPAEAAAPPPEPASDSGATAAAASPSASSPSATAPASAEAEPTPPPPSNGPLPGGTMPAPQAMAAVAAGDGPAIAAPYELIRTLQGIQDDIAAGSVAALNAQRVLLSRIDREFLAAPPDAWKEARNANALVAFILSGGSPVTLRTLLDRGIEPAIDDNLLRGSLAYAEGRESVAEPLLRDIDPRALPASIGGQVALAQAALSAAKDPAKTIALLDTGRLLAPGTLVEEAALRREILIVSQAGDNTKFEMLARQYLQRFSRSVYAGNFRQRFAAALTRMSYIDNPAQFARLDETLKLLRVNAQRELYLTIARASVSQGKTPAAILASERALDTAAPGSEDEARALVYRGAALAVTQDGLERGIGSLQASDASKLPPEDAALRAAAIQAAELIRTAAIPDGKLVQTTGAQVADANTPLDAAAPPTPAGAAPVTPAGTAPVAPAGATPAAPAGAAPVSPAGAAPGAPASSAAAPATAGGSNADAGTAQPQPTADSPAAVVQARSVLSAVDSLLADAPE